MELALVLDQSRFPATLTKTEQDCVNADNNVLAARSTISVSQCSRGPKSTAVAVSICLLLH
jgi:hypothetical protein